MKYIMSQQDRMHQQSLPIFLIALSLVLALFSPPQAVAGPALDCEGSAKAYALQGIPCYCRNGQIVCDQPSGKSGSSKNSSNGLSANNAIKLQLFQSVLDAVFLSPNNDASLQKQQEADRQYQLQRLQKERELELHRQKNFGEKRDQLLGALKGSGTGTLALKTSDDTAPLVDPAVLQEQDAFYNMNAEWIKKQKELIEQRLRTPNKYAGAINKSLKTKAPPLPWKTFNELEPGDVLLMAGENASKGITYIDNALSSNETNASHTVLCLKEVHGKKIFLDNQPGQGPRVISEDLFMKTYGHRGAEVAKLAQPLNPKESEELYRAAMEMAQKNNRKTIDHRILDSTNYGAWGKDNVVCSEADWALINAAGRKIPKSGDHTKVALGVNYSPADFENSQFFLVTPLVMP